MHATRINISHTAFAALRKGVKDSGYEPGYDEGFIVTRDEPERVEGTYLYRKTKVLKDFDKKTLAATEQKVKVLVKVPFVLDYRRGTLICSGPRSGLKVLNDAFGNMGVDAELEDFLLDLPAIAGLVLRSVTTGRVSKVKLSGYTDKRGLVGNPNFSAGTGAFERVVSDHESVESITVSWVAETKQRITISRRGSVTCTEGAEQERDLVIDAMPKHCLTAPSEPITAAVELAGKLKELGAEMTVVLPAAAG